jgi:hypothetical protein
MAAKSRIPRFDMADIQNWIKDCKKLPHLEYNPLIQTRGPWKGAWVFTEEVTSAGSGH